MTDTLTVPAPTAAAPAAATARIEPGIPLPLGLAGFGMTALVLSAINAGIFDAAITPVVLPMAFFFGGVTVIIAGMWAFARGETFPAVAMSALGSFWVVFAVLERFVVPGLPADVVGQAMGAYLLVWTVFAVGACIPAARTNVAVFAVVLGTALTFAALAIANLAGLSTMVTVGGVLGLLTGLTAVYTAVAILTNDMYGSERMPVKHL